MKIVYETENRSEVLAEIKANGQYVQVDNMTDLDPILLEQGIERHTSCFFIVAPMPTEQPTTSSQVAELEAIVTIQDQSILDLTYENILLQEGLQ